jgi:hypothetical protein
MNTNTRLFHKEVFWPKGKFSALQGRTLNLSYTPHAITEGTLDRYGAVQLPKEIVFDERNAIEMECVGKSVKKVLVRQPYNGTLDLCLVIFLNGTEFSVGTVWLNEHNDTHRTLNRAKYDRN